MLVSPGSSLAGSWDIEVASEHYIVSHFVVSTRTALLLSSHPHTATSRYLNPFPSNTQQRTPKVHHHHHHSTNQPKPARRRANLTDLANLANRALVLAMVL